MRLFFGVGISENVRESVIEAIREQNFGELPFKWVPPENYHFTLKFLGETGEERLPAIREAAAGVASGMEGGFNLSLDEFGAFPDLKRPRVIFYSVDEGGGQLVRLAENLDREMAGIGFRKDKRAYHPHLTLARIKKRLPAETISRLKNVPPLTAGNMQAVSSFQLIRSHLSRSGARYQKIADFSF